MTARRLLWLFGLLLLLTAVACGPAAPVAPVTPIAATTAAPTAPAAPSPTAEIAAIAPTATDAPTRTRRPTATPTRTPSPTRTPTLTPTPTPTVNLFGDYAPPAADAPTPPVPYPTPAPLLGRGPDVLVIALLGNDGPGALRQRTDAIVLAAVDTRARTAALLSVPRDLYVYQPGWRMERINLAMPHGGADLLRETVRYNLGVEIDYVVRVGFDGFQAAVDALEGITVPVLCPLEDWRIKAPDLDPTVEENWERFRLEPNVYQMDGALALWYARSRMTTTDFDRSRRQQQLLDALLEKALGRNVLADVPALWRAFEGQVMTDLPLTRMAQLATLAADVRNNGVRHFALSWSAVEQARIGPDRQWVWFLKWEGAESVLRAWQTPPALDRAQRSALTVAVVAENWVDYRLTAEVLLWQGFQPRFVQTWDPIPEETTIVYHGPNLKGSRSEAISWLYHNAPVQLAADPTAETAYTVTLGRNFNPCRLP